LTKNLPAEIAADLCALGHDAMTVIDQGMAGIDDERLMSRLDEEFRVFMTMDKGIANIQAYSPRRFAGLILLRPSVWSRGCTDIRAEETGSIAGPRPEGTLGRCECNGNSAQMRGSGSS
jgi:hypothetical protein